MGGGASKANVLTEKQIQKYVKDTVWLAMRTLGGGGQQRPLWGSPTGRRQGN
jgi:hypothetical protein